MQIEQAITTKLNERFQPSHLEVHNDSGKHNVPANSETHFRVVIVADAFSGQARLDRHRALNTALADFLAGPVHALALHPYAPDEWDATSDAPPSPDCMGGEK